MRMKGANYEDLWENTAPRTLSACVGNARQLNEINDSWRKK